MPTLQELEAEPWWNREVVTPELDWLGDEICRRTGRPRTAFGTKGDRRHLRGAHRSQEWIKRSAFCTSRTYTVQSGLTAEQERYIAGADFVPGDWGTAANRALMVEQTRRLVAALTAGRLAGVREVIGTLDGRTVVGTRPDGSTFDSDDSHLEHWHLTIDRRRLRDRALMERILAVALGEEDDIMAKLTDAEQQELLKKVRAVDARVNALMHLTPEITASWSDRDPAAVDRLPVVPLLTGLRAALGRDLVDEPAIVDGVLSGLATRPTEDVARALVAAGQDPAALAAALTALAGEQV